MKPKKASWLQRRALKQLFGETPGNRMAENITPFVELLAAVTADRKVDSNELYRLYQGILDWRDRAIGGTS